MHDMKIIDITNHFSETSTPLVSVVMPVYNAEVYLASAIESIVAQTYRHWELIIVDDNSKDSSRSIIRRYKKLYPEQIRAVFLRSTLNCGGDSATNQGVARAKGAFIAKMDADDIAVPTRFEKQVSYLKMHPDVYLVGSQAAVINAEGQIVGEKRVPVSHEEIFQEYIYFHPIIHPAVMFRNSGKSPFYQIKYKTANDYFTFFSLLCEGKRFVNLPEKLLYYRIDGKNASLKNIKKGLLANIRIKYDIARMYKYPLSPHAVLKNLAMFVIGMTLPQRVSFYLYLISKGIVSPKDIVREVQSALSLPRFSLARV